VVQQSHSRRARRTSSPRMTKVPVHKKQEVNEKRQNPATAHHTITTARHPDKTHSFALVRGRSTQFMATQAIPRNEITFPPFSRAFLIRFVTRDAEKFQFLDFDQLTKISPPFRISICISTSISSLIFHGTGCTDTTQSGPKNPSEN